MQFNKTCRTTVMIVDPPGEPAIMQGMWSLRTITGVIELSILLPGWIELASPPSSPNWLGVPGLLLKSSISLFNRKPAPSTTILLPKDEFMVVVVLTAFPYLSQTE